MGIKWVVQKVPTYPKQYKLVPVGSVIVRNDMSNFFTTKEQAQKEAQRRNKLPT